MCDKWSVVTTIFEPSEAVRRQAALKDWCLVVVGDKKGPTAYNIANKSTFVFLTPADQIELSTHFSMINNIPWNHFGRKNVGYLYAILHGAHMIWDFDDDNRLIDDMIPVDFSLYLSSEKEKAIDFGPPPTYEVLSYPSCNHTVFNPHLIMGAPRKPAYTLHITI